MSPTFTKKNNIQIAMVVILLLVVCFLINQSGGIVPSELFAIVFSNYLVTGLGAFIGLYATYKIGLRHFAGKGIFLLRVSSLFSLTGYALWDYYDFVAGVELPYPSFADISWSISIFSVIIGVLFLVRIYQPQIKTKFILEDVAVFAIMSAVIVYTLEWSDLGESTFGSGFFDVFTHSPAHFGLQSPSSHFVFQAGKYFLACWFIPFQWCLWLLEILRLLFEWQTKYFTTEILRTLFFCVRGSLQLRAFTLLPRHLATMHLKLKH